MALREGGKKAAATNKAKYGEDFYKRIGAQANHTRKGGFWYAKYVKGDVEFIRAASKRGVQQRLAQMTIRDKENTDTIGGKTVGYRAIHYWVEIRLGKPKRCDRCYVTDESQRYEWSNISGQYKRDITDWRRLCVPCHRLVDKVTKMDAEYCKHGHRLVLTNLYVRSNGWMECKMCRNEQVKRCYANKRSVN